VKKPLWIGIGSKAEGKTLAGYRVGREGGREEVKIWEGIRLGSPSSPARAKPFNPLESSATAIPRSP